MCCRVNWEKLGFRFSRVTLCAIKRHVSTLCLQTSPHIGCFESNRKSLVLFVVDSEDSDWLAWLYPSPYTAAHRFGIVIMALNGIFPSSAWGTRSRPTAASLSPVWSSPTAAVLSPVWSRSTAAEPSVVRPYSSFPEPLVVLPCSSFPEPLVVRPCSLPGSHTPSVSEDQRQAPVDTTDRGRG